MASQSLQSSWSDRVKGITSNSLQGDSSVGTNIEVTTVTANEQVSTTEFPPLGSGDSKKASEASQEKADSQREEEEAHLKGKSWADMFDDDDGDDIAEEFIANLNLNLDKKVEKKEEKEEKEEEEKTSKYSGGKHGTEASRWASAPDEPPRRSYYDNNNSNNNNNNRTYGSNYSRTQSNSNYNDNSSYGNNNYGNSNYGNNNYGNSSYGNSSYSSRYSNNSNNGYNNSNSSYKPRADTSFRRSDEEADKIYNQLKNEIYGTPIPPSSPEPTRFRHTDNSADAQKWNNYASTASSPTPAHTNRWTNDRYQSEPSTPPTNRNHLHDSSDKSSSSSRWANGSSASKWSNDRYDASEQAERSGNDSNSRWRNDRYSPSSGNAASASDNWRNDRNGPSEQLKSPVNTTSNSDVNRNPSEQPAPTSTDNSGRSTPQNAKWLNDRYEAPAEHAAASSQWSNYASDSNPSVNNRDQHRETYNTRTNNTERRGFNNSDEKAFEQLKNEIYGTAITTSASTRTDDDNESKKNWKKDENDQWVPIDTRDEKPTSNNVTTCPANSEWASDEPSSANSKWTGSGGELGSNETTHETSYMVKISNPNEGTHYWIKAYNPCQAINSDWGNVFSPSASADSNNGSNDGDTNNVANNQQWNAFSETNTNTTKSEENLPESTTPLDNSSQWVQASNENSNNNQWANIKSPIPNRSNATNANSDRSFSPQRYQDTIYTPAPMTSKWTNDKFEELIEKSSSPPPDPAANKWNQWAQKQN